MPQFTTAHRVNCRGQRNSEGTVLLVKTEMLHSIHGIKQFSDYGSNCHCLCTTWVQSDVQLLMVYKSPSYPATDFLDFLTNILEPLNGLIVIVGDFNLNLSKSENEIATLFQRKGLCSCLSYNFASTDGGTIIDYCFSNLDGLNAWYYESYYSYHKPICVTWNRNLQK